MEREGFQMNTIAERIKFAMKAKNKKQVDIVKDTGISKGAFSSYLSGQYNPKADKMELIADSLDVDLRWLYGENVPMENAQKDDTALQYVFYNNSCSEYLLDDLDDMYIAMKTQYSALIPRFYVLVNRSGNEVHILPLFLREDSSEFYDCNGIAMVKDAFNIEDFKHNKNILFTEGKTDAKYFKKAIEIFFKGKVDFEVKWIGKENEKGNPINTGKDALNNVERLLDTNPGMFENVIGLLYDCDTNKVVKETDLYFEYCLENIPQQHYKIGVENLLNLPADFDYAKFYSESKSEDGYGAPKSISKLNKNELCEYICSSENSVEYLKNFKKIIMEINKKFIELKNKN